MALLPSADFFDPSDSSGGLVGQTPTDWPAPETTIEPEAGSTRESQLCQKCQIIQITISRKLWSVAHPVHSRDKIRIHRVSKHFPDLPYDTSGFFHLLQFESYEASKFRNFRWIFSSMKQGRLKKYIRQRSPKMFGLGREYKIS